MGRRVVSVSKLAVASAAALLAACSDEGDPRPQLVVVLDTDAPVVAQLVGAPTLSADATIDTIRVDAIDEMGTPFDLRDFVAPEQTDWPISFGIAAGEVSLSGPVRLRIRAFRGRFALPGELHDVSTLEPRREVTIDRLVELAPPEEGILRVRVRLATDCMGVTPSFLTPVTTCIDGDRLAAAPTDGVEILPDESVPPSEVGSWSHAREIPCSVAPTEGQICIPGGMSILGDPALSGVGDGVILQDSLPLKPVLVSPFLMDRTELTVGRLRELIHDGQYDGPLPLPYDPNDEFDQWCTWRGADDPSQDDLPVNCASWDLAAQVCERLGGTLPTEAQWEHAGRGRGQRRRFAWGDHDVTCCATSIGRLGDPNLPVPCSHEGSGVEPVGSHPLSEDCAGLGDQSRDGVLDLSGSLTEPTLDKLRPYDHDCWDYQGIARDPVCIDDSAATRTSRGGYWNAGMLVALIALRSAYADNAPGSGLRCVYPGDGR